MSGVRAALAIALAMPLTAVEVVGDITGGGGRSSNGTLSLVGAVRAVGGTISGGGFTLIAAPTGSLSSTPSGTGTGTGSTTGISPNSSSGGGCGLGGGLAVMMLAAGLKLRRRCPFRAR